MQLSLGGQASQAGEGRRRGRAGWAVGTAWAKPWEGQKHFQGSKNSKKLERSS